MRPETWWDRLTDPFYRLSLVWSGLRLAIQDRKGSRGGDRR